MRSQSTLDALDIERLSKTPPHDIGPLFLSEYL